MICVFYGALLAAAIGLGAVRGHANVFATMGTSVSTTTTLLLGPLLGLAIGLGAVFATRVMTHRLQWARVLHQEFHALVQGLEAREIFLLALTSSIAEEAFFRGALQPMIGVVPQAALFAAMHFKPRKRFYPWTAMSLAVGLGFGLLTTWTGNLAAAIVAHFTINLLNLGYIARTELRA
jgi:membrane protease YdiL (CAAX protease family)